MLSLVTIGFMLVSLELIATLMFPRAGGGILDCVANGPTGVQGIPNTVCVHRLAEGEPSVYRLNNCGDRAGMECGPKPPGAYRIVTVGSSFVFGYGVPIEKSWTTLLPPKLSGQTGRNIEIYNKGMLWEFPKAVALRFNEVLASKPDMILWLLTSFDIDDAGEPDITKEKEIETGTSEPGKSASLPAIAWNHMKMAFAGKSLPEALSAIWQQTRSALLLQHFLYESQSLYVKSYVMRGDDALAAQPSARWQSGLQTFDREAANIEGRSRGAGVPFVAVLLPTRAQAAIISMGQWPAGIDPYKMDRTLCSIVTSHGGTYIDLLPLFRNIPNPERYYLPVDGHPNTSGHAVFAALLAKELTAGAVPALRSAARN